MRSGFNYLLSHITSIKCAFPRYQLSLISQSCQEVILILFCFLRVFKWMFQLKVGFWVWGFFFPFSLFTDNNLRTASGILFTNPRLSWSTESGHGLLLSSSDLISPWLIGATQVFSFPSPSGALSGAGGGPGPWHSLPVRAHCNLLQGELCWQGTVFMATGVLSVFSPCHYLEKTIT